jgi:Nucleotidyl transferase AbiEii toxin, Type IV TA system
MAADRAFYFDRLYPLQDQVLALLRQIETGFYLTGGTAASRGYLNHRFSDDLDLFVNDDRRFGLWADRLVAALTSRAGWTAEVTLREERFVRINLDGSGVLVKLELVDDVPAHVGTLTDHPILFRLDSAENILAKQLTALVDRSEPKDLADVWGVCCKLGLSIDDALVGAQSKAAGLFAPDVARVLVQSSVDDWRLVRWIDAPDADRYVEELHRLGEGLLLPGDR